MRIRLPAVVAATALAVLAMGCSSSSSSTQAAGAATASTGTAGASPACVGFTPSPGPTVTVQPSQSKEHYPLNWESAIVMRVSAPAKVTPGQNVGVSVSVENLSQEALTTYDLSVDLMTGPDGNTPLTPAKVVSYDTKRLQPSKEDEGGYLTGVLAAGETKVYDFVISVPHVAAQTDAVWVIGYVTMVNGKNGISWSKQAEAPACPQVNR